MKKNIRTLCQVALLVAVEVVLSRFCSINTDALKIGFSFLPVALCGMLFGPIWAAGAGASADFIGATLFPRGVYHPGFTIMAAVIGAVFGLFLYKKEKLRFFPELLCPALINCIICGLFINTIWVEQLYPTRSYWAWFMFRLTTQYIFMVTVYLITLPLLTRLSRALRKSGLTE